jgi:FkbM family methyltransferase
MISMSWPENFTCDYSMKVHLEKVFAGCYHIPGLTLPERPRILDLGANVGSFSTWALTQWPGATIYAYEPSEDNFRGYAKNLGFQDQVVDDAVAQQNNTGLYCRALGGEVWVQKAAVTPRELEWIFLYDGKYNTGEKGLFQHEGVKTGESVRVLHPKDLPEVDFVKCDVEGAEIEILEHYPHLDNVKGVSMEYHRLEELPKLINLMSLHGLRLVDIDRKEHLLKVMR